LIKNIDVAIKIIDHKKVKKSKILDKMMNEEVRILKQDNVFKNKHIIKLYERFSKDNKTYFVYEYCNGGSLQNMIDKKVEIKESFILKVLE